MKGLHLVVISPPKLTHVYYQNASYNRDRRVLNNGGLLIFDWCPLINNWRWGMNEFSHSVIVWEDLLMLTPLFQVTTRTLCAMHIKCLLAYTHCFIKQKSFPWTSWMKRGHQGSYYLTHVLNKDRLAYTSAKCLLFPKAPPWTLWKDQGWSSRVNQCCEVKKRSLQ